MAQINSYLTFNGNCREAMEFYKECLGGELSLMTVGESPLSKQMPATAVNNILHASLVSDSLVLLASDITRPEGYIKGNTIALTLDCDTEEEIKSLFSRLSAGGRITFPLAEQFWGATYGEVTDRFGINWLFNYDKNIIS